jgi:NAD+ synthase (glutamine-hydrolysing)
MAQLNLVVGDVDGNTSRIVAAAHEARDRYRADVVMLPELAVSGYPPEDLLFHSGMRTAGRALDRAAEKEVRGITLIAGYPEYDGSAIFNSAIVIRDGVCSPIIARPACPTTACSMRKRYFTPGHRTHRRRSERRQGGVLVCEDVWEAEPAKQARAPGRRCCWSSMPRPTKSTSKLSASRKSSARG